VFCQLGSVADKVALGQVFSEYFGFPANLNFIKFSILTVTRGRYIGQLVTDVPSGPSLDITPLYADLKKNKD
jgi:hypothetical protein